MRNMPLSQELSQLSQDEDSRAAPFETKGGEKKETCSYQANGKRKREE